MGVQALFRERLAVINLVSSWMLIKQFHYLSVLIVLFSGIGFTRNHSVQTNGVFLSHEHVFALEGLYQIYIPERY